MKKDNDPLVPKRWKPRVSSASDLVWELYQFLTDRDYECSPSYEALKLEPTPIEGVATFKKSFMGYKDFPRRSLWRLIVGIVLCLTVLLIPLGIWLIRKSKYILRHSFELSVDGESYRAGARTQDPHRPQSEVLDMASDARITLRAEVMRIRLGKIKVVKNKLETEKLAAEFVQLGKELDRLIPKIEIPKAVEDSG
jgi:hypothetical protein